MSQSGFPDGTVVKNPPANAGDTGLIPGPRGSHMSWSSYTRVLQLFSLGTYSPCSATKAATPTKSSSCSPQLRKPRCNSEDAVQQKTNNR